MELQSYDENKKLSIAPIVIVVLFFIALVVAAPFLLLEGSQWLEEYSARVLIPPTYPNSIEIVSGDLHVGGNCCISKHWEYCTEASFEELEEFFELHLGQLSEGGNASLYYVEFFPEVVGGDSIVMPNMSLRISEFHPDCEGMRWYSIGIIYETAY